MKCVNRILAQMTPVVAAIVVTVAARVADAKPTVAVAPFEGDDEGDVRDAVADALDGDEVDVLPKKQVVKALNKLGYEGELTEKQAKKVAKELEVDALVEATFGKKGINKQLRFTIYSGGKKKKGFKVTFNNEKNENFKSKLHDKLIEVIGVESSTGDDDDTDSKPRDVVTADDEVDKIHKKKGGGGDEDEEDKPTHKKKKRDVDPDEEPEVEAAVERVSPRNPTRTAVRVDLGSSFQNRSLTFNQRSHATYPQGPKDFHGSPVPGARIEGEVYPLAFGNPDGIAAGLGIGGVYDRTLSLNLKTQAEPGVTVPVKQYHWDFGIRFRLAFGHSDHAPSVTLGVSYGKRAFSPDRTGLMDGKSLDIPSTSYSFFDPSLAFRVPFIRQVALVGSAKGIFVSDAGPVQELNSYGRAKITGIEAMAGLDVIFAKHFGLRLAF
ncbi:hypothetical protein BH11MYX2_BH11MYX2_11640 [soil metagenome]